jgi:hypothetical protein
MLPVITARARYSLRGGSGWLGGESTDYCTVLLLSFCKEVRIGHENFCFLEKVAEKNKQLQGEMEDKEWRHRQ